MTSEPTDDAYELVANRRRRRVLACLRDAPDGVASVDQLTEYVEACEGPSAAGPTDMTRIRVELHHMHLPKLRDHGVVEYDERSDTVRYVGDERVERVLDSVRGSVSLRQ